MKTSLARRSVAEFLGTAFLVAAVIGSGIMAERLFGGNVAFALLANTIATGAALVALILTFGSISGAHLNPVVTIMDAWEKGLPWSEVPHYLLAQIFGGISGAIMAHAMFGLPAISLSRHARSGPSQWFSEFVATFGLLAVIWAVPGSAPMPFHTLWVPTSPLPTGSPPPRPSPIPPSPSPDASAIPSPAFVPSMSLGLSSLSS